MDKRIKLVIWDSENYSNVEEAQADGAVTNIIVPSHLSEWEQAKFIDGVIAGLTASGERLCNYKSKLGLTEITEHCHTVSVEVLEWNTYQFAVWASSESEARTKAVKENVSLRYDDVSYGTSEYKDSEPTDARLID